MRIMNSYLQLLGMIYKKTKVKFPPLVNEHHPTKKYGRVEIRLNEFLISALYGGLIYVAAALLLSLLGLMIFNDCRSYLASNGVKDDLSREVRLGRLS